MRPTQLHTPPGCPTTCSTPNVSISKCTFPCRTPNSLHHHHQQHHHRLPPVSVTNQGKEMRVAKLLEEAGLLDDDYILLDPDNPIPNPELGPLERRVSTTFEEGLGLEDVDHEAMKFWFTEPPEGWSREKRRLKKATVTVTDDVDEFRHSHEECSASGRRPLTDFQPGDILRGTVVKQMLYHGFQIDVGAEADALMWISELEAWQHLGEVAPDIGESIEVVVHAIRHDSVFRFPLQVTPTDAVLAARMPDPEGHIPPLDLREVKLANMPDVAARSGRSWAPTKVIVPVREDGPTADGEWCLTEEEMMELDDMMM